GAIAVWRSSAGRRRPGVRRETRRAVRLEPTGPCFSMRSAAVTGYGRDHALVAELPRVPTPHGTDRNSGLVPRRQSANVAWKPVQISDSASGTIVSPL